MVWWHIVLIIIIAYLIGNISVARTIAHKYHGDLTKVGSGNPGATNVMRSYGLKIGIINVVLDLLKGLLPTLVVVLVFPDQIAYKYICALAVVVGHIFPVVFKFKGGKGWATMIGAFWAINPILIACVMVINLVLWLLFKYSSLGTLVGVTILAFIEGMRVTAYAQPHRVISSLVLLAMYLIILWAHRSNIKRLLMGKEGKVDLVEAAHKKPTASTIQKEQKQKENVQGTTANTNKK